MCRYALAGPYKDRYACFRCRKAFKRRKSKDLPARMRPQNHEIEPAVVRCPDCRGPMHNMGMDFQAPRRNDVRQWRKVELLFERGVKFHSCGCGGPGLRPVTLREVEAFLADTLPMEEGQLLLKQFAIPRQGHPRRDHRQPGRPQRQTSGRNWGPVFPPRRPAPRQRTEGVMPSSPFLTPARKRATG